MLTRSQLTRALLVALPTAVLGFVLALMGLGVAGFYLAAVLTSPSIAWILAADLTPPRRRTPPDLG